MATRLPLIVSQPARRDASASDLIENIVAGALLVPRLDANLVSDISSMQLGSTDHLCLQGLTRDVIVASFLDMAAARQAWESLGQRGWFVDCSQAAAEIRRAAELAGSERRIYYFQLTMQTRVAGLLDKFQELVQSQASPLVSLQLGSSMSVVSGPRTTLPIVGSVASTPGPATRAEMKPASPLGPHTTQGAGTNSAAGVTPSGTRPPAENEEEEEEEFAELDSLVNQLDQLDL